MTFPKNRENLTTTDLYFPLVLWTYLILVMTYGAEYAALSLTLTSTPAFATVQTQILSILQLAWTIAVNFVKAFVLSESSTSSTLW